MMLQNIKIDFELLGGIILIEAEADGQKGLFVFDTGSTVTVINNSHHTFRTGRDDAGCEKDSS